MARLFIAIYLLAVLVSIVSSLECYVCINQPNNKDKCVKTTIQCEEHYDSCMSQYGEKQAMFWTPRMKRIYHISKSCAKTSVCQRERRNLNKNLTCQRDWYRDWVCAECCQGEKCNYYVTLGSAFQRPSTLLILMVGLIGAVFVLTS